MVQYTMPSDVSGFASLVQWANTVTQGYFGIFALISIFLVGVLQLKMVTNLRTALISSSFFTSIIGLTFWALGILVFNNFLIILIILGVVVMFSVFKGEKY